MNHLTNRRRSDGTHLDGWHGISELCDGSSWRCITKRDRLSWFGLIRFRTTVRVSKQEQVMFESSSKSRKSWDEWQVTWQWVPDIWSHYKALCARRLFVQRPHIVPIFGTPALKLQRYWIPPGPSRLCKSYRLHADVPQLAVEGLKIYNEKILQNPEKEKNTVINEKNTENFLKVRRLRNDSVLISGPVKLSSRRKRIQRTFWQ